MLKKLSFILVFLFSVSALAESHKCTEWTRTSGVSCVFAGSSASVYERQCENPCFRLPRNRGGNWGPDCQKERVCSDKDPRNFTSVCSEWVRVSGVTCRNPNTGDWEDQWKRVCTVGLKERWCSDEDPNDL